jgi:ElaA protein
VTLPLHRRWAKDLDAAALYALLQLRVEIFVVEQACPYLELDGLDLQPQTRHFWLETLGGEVISTLRLLQEDAGFRIGRVCTRAAERGRGHTARLMRAALADVGDRACRISAQTYLAEMYGRHGFVQDGAEFLEDGIPHVPMVRGARA